jgi:hypothetical protein
MGTQAMLMEFLLASFFALACFRARSDEPLDFRGFAPQRLFTLTDRLERLRRSRWQWFAMVLLVVLVRMQRGTPMIAELTVLGQFIVFLALPSGKALPEAVGRR